MSQGALIAQAGSSLLSAGSAYGQSKANKAAYKAQAAIARNNAKYLEWEAQDALKLGQREEQGVRMRTAGMKSDQTASLAARGLDIGAGSALRMLTDTDFMGEIDALTVRDDARRAAWGKREQAKGAVTDAGILSSRAKAESPFGAAFSTLLGSAGKVAETWRMTDWSKPPGGYRKGQPIG
jgi:hypothetical protein